MWIDGKFMTEPEIVAFIKQAKEEAFREGYLKAVDTMAQETAKEMSELEAERNAYKKELIETLRAAATCVRGDESCDGCPYYNITFGEGCPTKLSAYTAKLRLEDLGGRSHDN